MSFFYSAAWGVMLPFVLLRLWWLGRREPGYRYSITERLGFYPKLAFNSYRKVIWIHAVSVGETRAAEPVVHAVLSAFPNDSILLTHMTPTGRTAGRALFGELDCRVSQAYLPYDINWMVARFLRHFSPQICILMETEVWPNMIAQCRKFQVPVLLANARLSERSFKKALRLPGLFSQAAKGIACAAAQTKEDAMRLKELGVPHVEVMGSMKFDVSPSQAMLDRGMQMKRQFGTRKILLCASTREGEEALILKALTKRVLSDTLLVVVPRHPQRFNDVAKLIEAKGLRTYRKSALDNEQMPADTQVVLGDTMGEMFAYYAACDVAFIGGSLLPLGGQNLIEACAVGKPVLVGPHTFNFDAATENAVNAGAAIRVADADALFAQAIRLLNNEETRKNMGKNAKWFAEQHRGATQRTVALIQQILAETSRDGNI